MPKTDDTDYLTGEVPPPDAEPTPAERAHAKTFGELVDKTLAGRTPPAMSADDRALLEVATVIRAASGKVELPASTQRSVVEAALRQAAGGAGASSVIPISRGRTRRWAPWAVAAASSLVAAAAVLLLRLRPAPPAAALPAAWTSRPADPLVGRIERDHDADATSRIDTIFADRLDGYRDRQLARGGRP
jgi:hypothetical protein